MSKRKAAMKSRAGPSRAARNRKGRSLGLWVLGAIVLGFAFYYLDRSGPVETVEGVVVDTGTYVHGTRSGSHTHNEAVVEYEGRRYTIRPADNLGLNDPVAVTVRRGRITGYPYFDAAARR